MARGSKAERLEEDLPLNCAPQLSTTRKVVSNCGALALAFIYEPLHPPRELKLR